MTPSLYTRLGKPALDRVLAVAALTVLSPVLAGLAVLVRRRLGSPMLFRQTRAGADGRLFEIVKFRTMTDARGDDGVLLPDADRLPPFGRWLRSTSLDELPELWNVVRGEMSLVGPRPLLVQYLPLYTARQRRRHEARPGITGWAQTNGRNAATWEDRFEMDVWYVDHRTLRLDVQILFKTVMTVLRRDGITQDGHATVDYFTGSVQ